MLITRGGPTPGDAVLAGAGGVRAPADVFNDIFVVFLLLGTLVGIVVIAYTLYNAYKYRYREGEDPAPESDRPELGELPEGGGKGKKLFLSFTLSAIIVLSLIVWTYASLLYVENGAAQTLDDDEEAVEINTTGYRFGWEFTYPNGHTATTLRVPEDRVVNLTVTSRDVFHNFGIPELRVKADAIPGQTTDLWFVAKEPATYTANCYELCGVGHSDMTAEVIVMNQTAYQEWYAQTGESSDAADTNESDTSAANGTDAPAANGTDASAANGTDASAANGIEMSSPEMSSATNTVDTAAGAATDARAVSQP